MVHPLRCPRPCLRSAAAGLACFSLLVLGVAWLDGCGDESSTAPPPDGNTIGPAGGTAVSADGLATITIPAGALAEPTLISIAPVAAPPPGALAGSAYALGPETVTLAAPASLSISYDPASLPASVTEGSLRLGKLLGSVWLGVYGSAVDETANAVSASLHGFSTYGILLPGGDGELDSLTVTVVDAPAGSDEFPTLAIALAYLSSVLADEDLGIVVLKTNTTQSIAGLTLPFDLRLRLAPGYDPTIAGPGAAPLVVDAAGACDLQGLRIANAGGLMINANRNLTLVGCNLPATEVAIGGLKSARFPAGDPTYQSRQGAGDRARGANIAGNTLGGDLTYTLQADVTTSAAYALSGNSAPGVNVGGIGTLRAGASLSLLDNALGFIDADLKLDGQAALSVMNHTALAELSLAGEAAGGNPSINLTGNVSADLALSLKGTGKITINASMNDITSGSVDLTVKDYEFFGINQSYVNLVIMVGSAIANPDILWNEADAVFSGLTFDAVNTPNGKVTFGLERVRFDGNVAFNSKAELKIELTDDVDFNAAAEIRVESNLLDLTQTRVTYSGMATFVTQGASAGIAIHSQQGSFRDTARIIAPPTVGLNIVLDGTIFDQGGILYFGPTEKAADDWLARVAELDGLGLAAAAAPPASTLRAPARQGNSIELKGVHFERPGAAHIAIEQFDCPITIGDCELSTESAPAALALDGTQGDVTVRNTKFTGGGVAAFTTAGQVTIEDCEFTVSANGHYAILIPGPGTATVTGNTITAGGESAGVGIGNPGMVATITENTITATNVAVWVVQGRANVDNNDAIAGVIDVALGQMHLAGNSLAGATIVDSNPSGGLLNNPNENDGFDPEECFSFIDWDGNDCCDYPPSNNEPDDDGNCPCPGVPPPGG